MESRTVPGVVMTLYTYSVLFGSCILSAGALSFSAESSSRRSFLERAVIGPIGAASVLTAAPPPTHATEVLLSPADPDTRQLVSQARALELQGNLAAAQRLYEKVTAIAPTYVYGWSNLGNTQTAFGQLPQAEASYDRAIALCDRLEDESPGAVCNDLYLLYLNRGTLRLNTQRPAPALQDILQSNALRGRPDAVVLPNLARAYELTGQFEPAANAYRAALQMAGNDVSPYWLRASLVEYQLDRRTEGFALLERVRNRFPEAPEVRAAAAVYLWTQPPSDGADGAGAGSVDRRAEARQVFLSIPDRQRLKFCEEEYLDRTISWPPKMKAGIRAVTKAVGDC